jgi:hypothetical protein
VYGIAGIKITIIAVIFAVGFRTYFILSSHVGA